MEIEVKTFYNKDILEQVTNINCQEGIQNISTMIINLQEEGIKEALINLGWTPPKEEI